MNPEKRHIGFYPDADMKIVQMLPEFNEGGVERHVLWLSNELARRGHDVTVVSAGGKLERELKGAGHWKLPVHRKNPLTGLYCAIRIASRAKKEGWQILHSHSRVPSWIAWWASILCQVPFVVTAHAIYSRNFGLYPFKKADSVICVSKSVMDHLGGFLPSKSQVIYNGLLPVHETWSGGQEGITKFLFIGRLTRLKGVHILLRALEEIKSEKWTLDIVGDGPFRQDLQRLTGELDLKDRVFFHGFRTDTDQWMSGCSCLLFPSLEEGMGLTLMRAIQMGVPVIASDIPAVRELTECPGTLVEPGSVPSWQRSLKEYICHNEVSVGFSPERIHTVSVAAERIEEDIYTPLI